MEEVKKTGLTFIDTRRLANISYKDIKNGFIGFGYYLKIIRDEKLWQGQGYDSFNEFLGDEYGKDKSWASRCINLYDKFGIPVEPGELPRLEDAYEAYNVSQLIEMLPMDDGLREQVTPDMKIPDIRAMKPKRKKKVATVATAGPEPETEVIHFTAGSRTIDNAYGATIAAVVRAYLDAGYSRPEKECEVTAFGLVYKVLKRQDVTVFYPDSGRTVFDIENARLEEEYQYWHGTKAEPELVTSQVESEPGPQDEEPEPEPELPKSEQAHPEKSGKCIHRPEFDCTLEEAHKLIPGTGEDCGHKCCWECAKRGGCEWECNSSQRRPEHLEPPKQEETAIPVRDSAINTSNIQDTVIDGEFTEIQNTEQDIRDPEEPMTELQIAQDELERAKNLLKAGLECRVDENDIYIRRLKLKVCALASYVCDLDDIVNPPPKPEQPELPVLKNNDQRAAFVDAYETWPLWIETKQTGERYYRYDLEDGTSMVVKVYHARIFDGYASGSYEAKYHDGYGRHEYYLLRDGKFFRDCDTNRSLLIEKLKEIQKVKKGCN